MALAGVNTQDRSEGDSMKRTIITVVFFLYGMALFTLVLYGQIEPVVLR